MKQHLPEELIRKYAAGACTEEEKALVESWHLKELAESTDTPAQEQVAAAHERTRAALSRHIQSTRRTPVTRSIGFRVAAAAVLLLVVGSLWVVVDRRNSEQSAKPQVSAAKDEVLPGKDGAILTLADGRTIILDSANNGNIAEQGDVAITKQGGQIVYSATDSRLPANDSRLTYNTMTTPRGRQFQLVLPDGTKVWLNAASSIRYPTVFAGNERRVEITGEAYFEVAKVSSPKFRGGREGAMPFIVKSNGQEVEVLGTHFNINAYDDEDAIRTTLLEGKVKVVNRESSIVNERFVILQPGEQAAITTNHNLSRQVGKLQTTNKIDIDKIMAWKNGVFNFQDATLQEVMRQLARWYDIEVVYEKTIPVIEFEGEMNRGNPLSEVLKSLEKLGVHVSMEGRRLVVLP